MDETIARLNIEHFQRKLAEETDEAKCRTLRQLLAEEQAKLERILSEQKKSDRSV